jgi:membrane protease YdiL (CAAX protease family)
LLTATTMTICISLPYILGQNQRGLDADVIATYPLQRFLPVGSMSPLGFVAFVMVAGPFVHLLNALGEEIFWRGYLLDWLEARNNQGRAWLLNGLLWGVWHAPMIILLGWDFPGHPLLGTFAITASQVFWSIVLCHVTRRSGSLWPAVIMHTTANAMTIGLFDLLIDHELNLIYSPWGLLGGIVMAVATAVIYVSRSPRHQIDRQGA